MTLSFCAVADTNTGDSDQGSKQRIEDVDCEMEYWDCSAATPSVRDFA